MQLVSLDGSVHVNQNALVLFWAPLHPLARGPWVQSRSGGISVIQLQSVSKSYHGQTRVLDHVQLEVSKGDFLYVVGGSGAGKSSLLRILATDDEPTAGNVSLFGYDLSRSPANLVTRIRRTIGYVPQDLRLIGDLSVFDNVALSVQLSERKLGEAAARQEILALLARLGLEAKKNLPVSMLSGGEAQRVAFARALARKPELIIADEPTGSQDRDFTWSMMDLLLKANLEGTTVIVATHDREIVRRVRKRCAVLKEGRLRVEDGLCIY